MKNNKPLALILTMLVLLILVVSCTGFGKKLEFQNAAVYYTESVTEDDAKKLGKFLIASELTTEGGEEISFQLNKENDVYQIRMVVREDARESAETVEFLTIVANAASAEIFENQTTEVHICDDYLKTVKVVKQSN